MPQSATIIGEDLCLDTDMYKTKLNSNMLVIGTPGSGKTTGIVEPNILQMNSSYVVLDPKQPSSQVSSHA